MIELFPFFVFYQIFGNIHSQPLNTTSSSTSSTSSRSVELIQKIIRNVVEELEKLTSTKQDERTMKNS